MVRRWDAAWHGTAPRGGFGLVGLGKSEWIRMSEGSHAISYQLPATQWSLIQCSICDCICACESRRAAAWCLVLGAAWHPFELCWVSVTTGLLSFDNYDYVASLVLFLYFFFFSFFFCSFRSFLRRHACMRLVLSCLAYSLVPT